MVYASLQEAWGGLNNDFSRIPPENPYVVKDAAPPNPANFNYFQKKHNFAHNEEQEEYSQISMPPMPRSQPRSQPPQIQEQQQQQQQNHHYNKKVDCVSMIAHLQTCKICSAELAENTRNVFIREFVLFAGCGLIMFLFLDLIRKIAQKI